MPRDFRLRMILFVVGATLSLALAAPAPEPTSSALAQDPQGWLDLLDGAGTELKGWTRSPIPPDGKLDADSQWKFDPRTGILTCEGTGGHDWVRWDRELSDFIYHVEWRFTPVTSGKKAYNSGIYARNSADAKIWHQAQTGDAKGGYIFGETPVHGKIARVNFSKQVRDSRVKPAGEWNTFEITCKGKDMSLWVNGAVTLDWHDCEVPTGFVGLEAERYRIEFRHVKLKPL
ncbi:3-keto-disaccharide hydrolase [Singulisphaera acidiphila]|uniref:3-keto-alpha-glucoside-1,2-lyase/3-keto-2-hydroxy-glucal hydratase domain-containing protein n=1 Tax=Singulisphaera acidiphila (strain ATCC BAA-1392 / DSM 18658 / VKM B-2454 / MOB10) TaxID=886293 RepID=L0DM81_SINAD|nr:DUF1080 domain-containing protein [Singulisphaera acidiphila]AGA29796.1 protein of unknown function (DUF1080) [Singulisphaera acidiphila DSM 18658]